MTVDDTARALDQTATALDGGPTGLTPSAALLLIEQWHAACLAEDKVDLSGVAEGLAMLRTQLTGRLDGAALAGTLTRLADGTSAAAAQASDARFQPTLETLAATLRRFASVLS